MIEMREILAISQQTSVTPHVVEKDYVLGWMLAGTPFEHYELALARSAISDEGRGPGHEQARN